MNNLFAQLRDLLIQKMSETLFQKILHLFEEWPSGNEQILALDYANQHLEHWPTEMRSVHNLVLHKTPAAWLLVRSVRFSRPKIKRLPKKFLALLNQGNIQHLDLSGCEKLSSLDGLEEMSLQSLVLDGCKSITTLHDLPNPKHLKVLWLEKMFSLQDITGLKSLSSLQELHLKNLPWVKDLTPLSSLKKLEKLFLRDCAKIRELPIFSSLLSLTELKLSNCEMLKSLDGIGNIRSLRNLWIGSCPRLSLGMLQPLDTLVCLSFFEDKETRSLESLKGFKTLTELNLSNFTALESSRGIENLQALQKIEIRNASLSEDVDAFYELPELTRLCFQNCNVPLDLNRLRNPKKIRSFQVSNGSNIWNVRSLSLFSGLEELFWQPFQEAFDIQWLTSLFSLKVLSLTHCDSIENLSLLKELQSIETLDFQASYAIRELSFLEGMQALRKLNLRGCTLLKDVAGLEGLSNLEVLDCVYVPFVSAKSFSGLTSLKSVWIDGEQFESLQPSFVFWKDLESLHILRWEKSVSLSFLRYFPNLKKLYISYCRKLRDVKPLADLPCLEFLHLQYCDSIDVSMRKWRLSSRQEVETYQKQIQDYYAQQKP